MRAGSFCCAGVGAGAWYTGEVNQDFIVSDGESGQTLAAVLRSRLGIAWSAARALCERGKVTLADRLTLDSARRVRVGMTIAVRPQAPRPLSERATQALAAIVYEDSQVVVIDKPAGLQSVPYERDGSDTAMDFIREAWRHSRKDGRSASEIPLHVVHRIDKETSGLLLFAKTKKALRELQLRWRAHDIERRYLCVVHGRLLDRTIESYFVDDRGDGLRGSLRPRWRDDGTPLPLPPGLGKRAVTHVQALEFIDRTATYCAITIETGKTHQIRIHLSESGHPVVGEQVYIRDYLRAGLVPLSSPRLLLHAETLGFAHPTTGEIIRLHRPPPPAFISTLAQLRSIQASTFSIS